MVQKRVMGIDASTTTIGICILIYDDDDNNIILDHTEFYKPPKKGNVFERLLKVKHYIIDKLNELKPDIIALEDIILFMGGKSTAQTTTILSALNRIIGVTILEKTNKLPYLYGVNFIRKTIKNTTKTPKKEDIPDLVADILGIDFPYVKNKKGNVSVENFDIADSIAAALCYIIIDKNNLNHNQDIKPRKRKKKKR